MVPRTNIISRGNTFLQRQLPLQALQRSITNCGSELTLCSCACTAVGTRISGVDDSTYSITGEAFSQIVAADSATHTSRLLQEDDVSLGMPMLARGCPICISSALSLPAQPTNLLVSSRGRVAIDSNSSSVVSLLTSSIPAPVCAQYTAENLSEKGVRCLARSLIPVVPRSVAPRQLAELLCFCVADP